MVSDADCMIGSANKAWVSCPCIGSSDFSAMTVVESIRNVSGTEFYFEFQLPLPTNRGGKKLYVDRVMVLLNQADANNKITMIKVLGFKYDSATLLLNDTTSYTSQQQIEVATTSTDAYSYNIIAVNLYATVATGGNLKVLGVQLRCWYDT